MSRIFMERGTMSRIFMERGTMSRIFMERGTMSRSWGAQRQRRAVSPPAH